MVRVIRDPWVILGVFLGLFFWVMVGLASPSQSADTSPLSISTRCASNNTQLIVKVSSVKPTWVTFHNIDNGKNIHVKVNGAVSFRTGASLWNVTYRGQETFPRDPSRNTCGLVK